MSRIFASPDKARPRTAGQRKASRGIKAPLSPAAIREVVGGRRLQPKLRIGDPTDRYEREADRVADQVMRMPPQAVTEEGEAPDLQRMCTDCEEERLQRQPRVRRQTVEEEVERVQANRAGGEPRPGENSAAEAIRSLSGGRALTRAERGFFEPRMGARFGDVRIHDGAAAAERARSIGAQAFTYGRNVVLDRARYRPDTRAGRHLMAHELTHVIQQRAGRTGIQRAPADFTITGKHSALGAQPWRIYFLRGSATVDSAEKKKIPGIVKRIGRDILIKGYRSRDEAASVAGKRARAVETAIGAHDKTVKTKVQAEKDSYLGSSQYRRLRVAIPMKNTVRSAARVCPRGAEKIKRKCPSAHVYLPMLFADAELDLVIARRILEIHRANPQKFKHAKGKLRKYFRQGFNMGRVISDLKKIQKQTQTIARKDVGRTSRRPGYRCGTKCEGDCRTSAAYSQNVGSRQRLTLCPEVWEQPNSDDSRATLIHEVSHGTPGIGRRGRGTDDVVYEGEKVWRFLTNPEALQSADVFAEFVHEIRVGSPRTKQSTTRDDVSALAPKHRAQVEESLARLAKWLQAASSTLTSLHPNVVKASRSGWGSKWGRPYMAELSKLFRLTKPPRWPKEKDIRAVAAIADRVRLLSKLTNDHKIKASPTAIFTRWTMKGSPAPSLLPGVHVELDPQMHAYRGAAGGIRDLLEALLRAAPTVSSALAPKYESLIDFLRKKENIGP